METREIEMATLGGIVGLWDCGIVWGVGCGGGFFAELLPRLALECTCIPPLQPEQVPSESTTTTSPRASRRTHTMADAQKPTPEQEESRLNLRTSALDWFMNPVPQSRCSPSLETSDDKRLEEMKAMLRSRPVSTESRFIKASDAPKPVALNQKKWAEFPLEQRIDINHNTRRCPHPHLHPHPHPNPHPNPLQPQPQPQPPPQYTRLRFRLPVEDLGLPVGMHIFLKGSVGGKPVMRAYTPVLVGPYFVDFVIKVHLPLPA